MKTPLLVAAAGLIAISAVIPSQAHASSVNFDISIGIPAVVPPPRVVYQPPVVVYPAPAVRYAPYPYHHTYYKYPYYHTYAPVHSGPAYGYNYGGGKRIAEVEVNRHFDRR